MRVSKKQQTIAYHEAGHTVAALHLNVPFEFVTINPSHGALGFVQCSTALNVFGEWTYQDRYYAKKMVVMLLSGMAAEELIFGKYRATFAYEDRFDADALSSRLATGKPRTYYCRAYARAGRILRENLWQVDTIAQALLSRRELTRVQVADLLSTRKGHLLDLECAENRM